MKYLNFSLFRKEITNMDLTAQADRETYIRVTLWLGIISLVVSALYIWLLYFLGGEQLITAIMKENPGTAPFTYSFYALTFIFKLLIVPVTAQRLNDIRILRFFAAIVFFPAQIVVLAFSIYLMLVKGKPEKVV